MCELQQALVIRRDICRELAVHREPLQTRKPVDVQICSFGGTHPLTLTSGLFEACRDCAH